MFNKICQHLFSLGVVTSVPHDISQSGTRSTLFMLVFDANVYNINMSIKFFQSSLIFASEAKAWSQPQKEILDKYTQSFVS
jgi:hypothetical protein